ncbi:hypothetical protein Tco_0636735 [Tanacetum coccineum]
MSTTSARQHALADVRSETRPPMLERCSPYKFKKIQPNLNQLERDQTEDDLTGDDLKQYKADIEAMSLILISIPNDIYNSVNSCQTAKDMWLQYEKLVIASRAKKAAKTHDPLALVAHTSSSSSRSPTPYYVTHPPSVIEESSANICMMARIQQANTDSDEGPSYDSAFISEVQTPSTSFMNPLFSKSDHEQTYHEQHKIISSTNNDDQINSDIIFDDPNVEVNDGSVEHDKNAHDQHDNELELLARNAYQEAEKKLILAKKDKQQNLELTKQLEQYKERFNTTEDKYLDDVLNLEAKLKMNENMVMKMSNSVQALFMLGPKPLSVYDPQLKYGLGYENPYTLKQAISENPKLYDASYLYSSNVRANVRDTEEILEDTTKS